MALIWQLSTIYTPVLWLLLTIVDMHRGITAQRYFFLHMYYYERMANTVHKITQFCWRGGGGFFTGCRIFG